MRIPDLPTKASLSRQDGQTMAEYAMVLGVISVAVIAVFGVLRNEIIAAVSQMAGFV